MQTAPLEDRDEDGGKVVVVLVLQG